MTFQAGAKERGRIFYGWYIVLGAFLINLWNGSTYIYGFSAFFNPIRTQFGWSYAQTAVAFSLRRLETGLAAPVVGFIVDKVGPRKLMLVGVPLTALSLFFLSSINSLGMFYVAFLVNAAGQSAASMMVTTVAVNNWFRRKKGRAFAIMALGYGLSGWGVPLVVLLIAGVGWRTALIIVGLGWLVVGLPVAAIMRQRPEQYGYLPDGDLTKAPVAVSKEAERIPVIEEYHFTWREALRTRSFLFTSLIATTQGVVMGAVMTLEIPYLESIGYSTGTAALILTAMTTVSLIGRLGLGSLTDWIEPRFVYMIIFALEGVGLLAYSYLEPGNLFLLIIFLAAYPVGYGASTPVRPAMLGKYFGRESFGAIQGLQSLVTMWPSIAAPVFAGWAYDTMGSFRFAWLTFAALCFLSIPVAILATRPRRPALKGAVGMAAEADRPA